MRYDVFIAFSSKDVEIVGDVYNDINANGKRVYCDIFNWKENILYKSLDTDTIAKILKEELRESASLLVVDTINSRKSRWVGFEVEFFKEMKRPIQYTPYQQT